MRYLQSLDAYHETCDTAITLGKFDGLHRGHMKLVEQVMNCAVDDVKSMVFAFDMKDFRRKMELPYEQIMSSDEKIAYLEGKVDYLIECPFTEEIQKMSAERFVEEILVKKFRAKYIVVGADFHFGYKQNGDSKLLQEMAEKFDYQVIVVEKELYQGREISSTYIKEEVVRGNMEVVNALLGYPLSFEGEVIHGKKLGRKLGFPTMNVVPCDLKLFPPRGVYVCRTIIDGQVYYGIANLGCKPTVSANEQTLIEVYVFDYENDTYGKEIRIAFLHYERSEQKFNSVDTLKNQVLKDIENTKEYIAKFVYNS